VRNQFVQPLRAAAHRIAAAPTPGRMHVARRADASGIALTSEARAEALERELQRGDVGAAAVDR
jgi:hypothetical protein